MSSVSTVSLDIYSYLFTIFFQNLFLFPLRLISGTQKVKNYTISRQTESPHEPNQRPPDHDNEGL